MSWPSQAPTPAGTALRPTTCQWLVNAAIENAEMVTPVIHPAEMVLPQLMSPA